MPRILGTPPILLATLCVVIGAALACSDDTDETRSPTQTPAPTANSGSPTETAAPADGERWNEDAAWMPISDELAACGDPATLDPENDEDDDACIAELAGEAGPAVAEFFAATTRFLFGMSAGDGIDVGRAGAPWLNEGRGELVFLNGSPDVIFAAEHVTDRWMSVPQYRDFIAESEISAWFEYWIVESHTVSGDGEWFIVAYNLQECRDCAVAGFLRVAYVFGADGSLSDVSLRSLGCAPDLAEPDPSCHQ